MTLVIFKKASVVFHQGLTHELFRHGGGSPGNQIVTIYPGANYYCAVFLGLRLCHGQVVGRWEHKPPSHGSVRRQSITIPNPVQLPWHRGTLPPHILESPSMTFRFAFILSTSGTRRFSLRPFRIICIYSSLQKSPGSIFVEHR